MKKIMFSDAFCLTKAVLDGTKTMTRRAVPQSLLDKYDVWYEDFIYNPVGEEEYLSVDEYVLKCAHYKVGEIVAIAQRYKEIYPNADFEMIDGNFITESAGWTNKMFVRADLMLRHIRITDVKIEHLRDISEEDALREGIFKLISGFYCFPNEEYAVFSTPRRAFAELIDKVSGKGTWESNPWVVAYSFELVD